MNKYEELLDYSESIGVTVDENFPFQGDLSSLYVSGNIALSDRLVTTAQKSCILAEELGHHLTSSGVILNQKEVKNRKQERRARMVAYDFMVSPADLVKAYLAGCRNRYEVAEFLGVTEEFLQELLEAWSQKYGMGFCIDGYRICLVPNLQILPLEP